MFLQSALKRSRRKRSMFKNRILKKLFLNRGLRPIRVLMGNQREDTQKHTPSVTGQISQEPSGRSSCFVFLRVLQENTKKMYSFCLLDTTPTLLLSNTRTAIRHRTNWLFLRNKQNRQENNRNHQKLDAPAS